VNSYIDIPVVGYYRLGPIELEGGLSAGFLVNSRASGGGTLTNTFVNGTQNRFPDDLSFNYDYNYFRDGVGTASIVEFNPDPLSTGLIPPGIIGAYYNSTDDTPLYRRFDFAVIAGLSYFLNNGLYLSARYQYGLTDVTRPDNDRRITSLPGEPEVAFNTEDKDYHRTIQAAVGFRF
jgi:opacity protein-like surface antigen